jgi:hypothetical protein
MGWKTVFRGTDEEQSDLLAALEHNCTCEYSDEDKTGPRVKTCVGHSALVNDQRFLDGLLWVRHNRDIYKAKEWGAL